METLTLQNLKVNEMSVRQKAHPEYGTWGIRCAGFHKGYPLFSVIGRSGSMNLSVGEFKFWEIVR